ncbi:MAG: aspartate carbamoyltransferase catalytic subunit [Ruminococcaceae bacterium]|nr:aspartate carbamoyltransferase catalytic subunit [Oscillospiraceae bacterium]
MKFEKDLLGIQNLDADQIHYILNKAKEMKKIIFSDCKKATNLTGKSVMTLFYENSTRTRTSFELASKYLGAIASNMAVSSSSVKKGETLIDTTRTLNAMGNDCFIIRHENAGAPHLVAQNVSASVINAGDGMNEHPTQALLDFFTMYEKMGTVEGKKIAIIGDIYHSRVARSDTYGLLKLGAEVVMAGPRTLLPNDLESLGVKMYTDVDKAIRDADVVMPLRLQLERQKNCFFPSGYEYAKYFGVNEERMKLAKEGALIMHPGPVNRGLELQSLLYSPDKSVIDEQVTNGVAVRMAVLDTFINRA